MSDYGRRGFQEDGGKLGQGVDTLKKRRVGLEHSFELKMIYRSWYMKKFVPIFFLKHTVHFWVEPPKNS